MMPAALAWRLDSILAEATGARARRRRRAQAAFAALSSKLAQGDLAVDLGANKGEYTVQMAARGADVTAYEPEPDAFALLQAAVLDLPTVRLVQAAATTASGTAWLHRTHGFDQDPARHSTSSSLLADKRNIDPAGAVIVETVDIVAALAALERPISLIKMDVEGAEVAILEALLDHPLAEQIGVIFVETHERSVPQRGAPRWALKRRTRRRARPRIIWDWH